MIPEEAPRSNVSNIPHALKQKPQWVLWKYEGDDHNPTKVPYSVKGAKASTQNKADWASFEQVMGAYQPDRYSGVGFVFTAEDEFCGIDLDHCIRPDGSLEPWAEPIVQKLKSYTEISPSGTGLKIFVRAKCRDGKKRFDIDKTAGKRIEVYDSGRYFTVTGNIWPNSKSEISWLQEELDELYAQGFGTETSGNSGQKGQSGRNCRPSTPGDPAMASARSYIEKLPPAISGQRGHDATFHAACTCFRFGLTDDQAWELLAEFNQRCQPPWSESELRHKLTDARTRVEKDGQIGLFLEGHLPIILLGTDEHRVIDEVIKVLALEDQIYQRAGLLVRICQNTGRVCTIERLPSASLREILTRHARFVGTTPSGKVRDSHPPQWLVEGIEARGNWPSIRQLSGVSGVPVLRPNGSLFQTPGYDPETGVYYAPQGHPIVIRDPLTLEDARGAVRRIEEVLSDFNFKSPADRSAWFAALLSPLVRYAVDGTMPLFLALANVRGAGKTLIIQVISQIVLGGNIPVFNYACDVEEMRKKITSIAIAGDSMVLLDNLVGNFGNEVLNRALTATFWRDRLLGKNDLVELPLKTIWYGTGNNTTVETDLSRRTVPIRLEVMEEYPEKRQGFRHPELLLWVKTNRLCLLQAAFTILVAYCQAGRPKQNLRPFGSFEEWSELIRGALVWAGLPDPLEAREEFLAISDTGSDALRQLIAALQGYEHSTRGFVVSSLIADLYSSTPPNDIASVALRAAIEEFCGCAAGKKPSARQFGNKLKSVRRRPCGGWYLDIDTNRNNRNGTVWRLYQSTSGTDNSRQSDGSGLDTTPEAPRPAMVSPPPSGGNKDAFSKYQREVFLSSDFVEPDEFCESGDSGESVSPPLKENLKT